MTCKDAIDLLGEFLEGALRSEDAARLEAHLAGCEPCRAYLATYRRTRELTAAEGRVDMPEEMKTRLRAFLLERLQDRPGP